MHRRRVKRQEGIVQKSPFAKPPPEKEAPPPQTFSWNYLFAKPIPSRLEFLTGTNGMYLDDRDRVFMLEDEDGEKIDKTVTFYYMFNIYMMSRVILMICQLVGALKDFRTDSFKVEYRSGPDWFFKNAFLLGVTRWDSQHYIFIAEHNYKFEQHLAFYPAFPQAIRYMAQLYRPFVHSDALYNMDSMIIVSGFALNLMMTPFTAFILYQLALNMTKSVRVATLACSFFMFNPASIFFLSLYTEPMFSFFTFFGIFMMSMSSDNTFLPRFLSGVIGVCSFIACSLVSYEFRDSKGSYTGVPVVTSNMDTVGTFEMAQALHSHGLFTTIHKHYTVQEWQEFAASVEDSIIDNLVVSSGISSNDFEKLSQVIESIPALKFICLDVANGYSEFCVHFIRKVAKAGDVAKEFGAGADFAMIGGLFTGHDQSGGDLIENNGKKFKLFYGMSSDTAMKKHHGSVAEYRASEGKTITIPFRSNGILNLGYVAATYFSLIVWPSKSVHRLHGVVYEKRTFLTNLPRRTIVVKVFFLLTTFLVAAVGFIMPIKSFSQHIQRTFCTDSPALVAALSKVYGNYVNTYGMILPGQRSEMAWCNKTAPLVQLSPIFWSSVQEKYWDVKPFGYWQFKKIPFFLLGMPAFLIVLAATVGPFLKTIRRAEPINIWTLFFTADSMFVMGVHALFLGIYSLIYVNFEVFTRIIFSSTPFIYIYLAKWVVQKWEEDRLPVRLNDYSMLLPLFFSRSVWKRWQGKLLIIYFTLYFVIGSWAHSANLPFT